MKKILLIAISIVVIAGNLSADILAGIEIGPKSVTARVIDFQGEENSMNKYKILYKEEINTDNMTDTRLQWMKRTIIAIETVQKAIKSYNPNYLAIVAPQTIQNKMYWTNLEKILNNDKGLTVNYVSSDEDLIYSLFTNVPKRYLQNFTIAFVGKESTEIAYTTPMNSKKFESFIFPYGIKNFTEKAKSELVPWVEKVVKDKPELKNPNQWIFMEGGVSLGVAYYGNQKDILKPYLKLSFKDVLKAEQMFKDSSYRDIKPNNKADEDTLLRINNNFDINQLQIGSNIFSTILGALEAKNRVIAFDENGEGLLGYLIANYKK